MELKYQFNIYNNIVRLLKQKGLKNAELEAYVDVSQGLLSRWRMKLKNKKPFNPNLDVLLKMADYLEVSIDYLILRTSDTRASINETIDFLDDVFRQTGLETIHWSATTKEDRDRMEEYHGEPYMGPILRELFFDGGYDDRELPFYPPHIREDIQNSVACSSDMYIVWWIGGYSLEAGRMINDFFYDKVDFLDSEVFYEVKLEKIESTLYIYKTRYVNSTDETVPAMEVYEAYLKDKKWNTHYLCNSVEWGSQIQKQLRDLYRMAEDHCSRLRMDTEALKLIRKYNGKS